MKVAARVKLEKEDLSLIREIITRDITVDFKRLNSAKLQEAPSHIITIAPLVRLVETLLNDAFSRGMEFRDRNMATHIEVE